MSNTCAPSGGANSTKTTLPPPSTEYRNNYDEIFREDREENKNDEQVNPPEKKE